LVKDANLKVDELNHVLLIGGSCRIPYVRKLLEARLTEPLFHLREPDLAVCQGAVLFASGTTVNRVVKITRDGKGKSNQFGGTNMNKIKTKVKTKIIGFDLGHGETALHWTWDDAHSNGKSPESFKIAGQPESFITAIAYDEKQEKVIAIGEKAITNPKNRNIDICFKARPDSVATEKIIKDYVEYIYNYLVATKSINANQDYQILFYVGHPSGWEKESFNLYQQILAEVLPNVKVAPESRAGLMSVIESNQVNSEELKKSVLVIDIGSSTTDFTLVGNKLNQPFEESGIELGGALIDEAIYEQSLAKLQQNLEAAKKEAEQRLEYIEEQNDDDDQDSKEQELREELGEFITDPRALYEAVRKVLSKDKSRTQNKQKKALEDVKKELKERIDAIENNQKIFAPESNDRSKSIAKLNCRKHKECYFNDGFLGESYDLALKGGFIFEQIKEKNKHELKQIINKKIKLLGNKTWEETFRQQLESVKNKLDKKNIEPGALFLTGGASRMSFLQDICEELFPGAKFVRDTKPEICISKGLAFWGKTDYKVAGFLEEVEKFLEKDLLRVIRGNIPSFFDSLSEVLSEKILYKIVKPSMLDWQRGYTTTLRSMEEKILESSKKWLDGEEAKEIISDIVKLWLQNQVLKDIEKEIDKISDKYELPKGSLIYGYGIPDQVGINSTEFSYQGQRITLEASEMPLLALQIAISGVVAYFVVTAILGVVSAIIYGLIALLVSSIIGAIIAVILGVLALFLWIPAVAEWAKKTIGDVSQAVSGAVSNATRQAIRTNNIPSPIRPMLLSNSKVDKILTDNKSEIKSEIQKSLEGESKLVNKIVEETKEPVKKLIETQAERAKLLIF
nr:Hsp70 family protein [Microcoleaceae cyanobacterium MO_207.B10]